MITITDEQIIQIAKNSKTAEPGSDGYILPISFARELIALAQPQWQPIETAPKDGTEILVTYGRQGFVMQLVKFDRRFNYWKSKGEVKLGLENNATHWMPLPKPPEVKE